jgi:pyridoxamine 5'-phosphate oxidase
MDKELVETLEELRVNYQLAELGINDCDPDPERQFDKWLQEAINTRVDEPNAFVLSTVSDGRPRGRVVLLKGVHAGEFVFYTNYESSKGRELERSPFAAMTFCWLPLQRQVRIEGTIGRVAAELSDDYFHKRPRGSQLGAIASPQSQVVPSRAELERLYREAEEKFGSNQTIPRPAHWGGFAIRPSYFEFWQGRRNRLHDRIAYELKDGVWQKQRLAP